MVTSSDEEILKEMGQEDIVVHPLWWFFCFLGCGSFPFCSSYSPFFGCFGFFMIGKVSSFGGF
jgi:hypothetical protein